MNYFCDLNIVVDHCHIRDISPRICCCFCPDREECHSLQRKDLTSGEQYVIIMPCIVENKEVDYCSECEHSI